MIYHFDEIKLPFWPGEKCWVRICLRVVKNIFLIGPAQPIHGNIQLLIFNRINYDRSEAKRVFIYIHSSDVRHIRIRIRVFHSLKNADADVYQRF